MAERICTVADCDRPTSRGRATYCEAHYYRIRRTGTAELVRTWTCEGCGRQNERRGQRGRVPTRCAECRAVPLKVWATEWVCVVCGADVQKGSGYRKYCSVNCHSVGQRTRDQRPKLTHCGRCAIAIDLTQRDASGRLRNANTLLCVNCRRAPKYFALTVAEIAARDGLACSICGQPVDLNVSCPDDMSPSVDHIHPWSLGGTHEASNLALAHRICNVRKGVAT